MESGAIVVGGLNLTVDGHISMMRISEYESNGGLAVNAIKWRPGVGRPTQHLATCGEDTTVRIFEVTLDSKN